MKRASLLVLGTAALALNACIKIETGAPPTPAAPQAAAPAATAVAAAPTPAPAPTAAPAPAPAPVSNFTPIDNGLTDEVQVFDPPSNVRRSPNGAVICAVRQKQFIKISGYTSTSKGTWYKTNACGEAGWIHVSQVRF
ncbi:hypothetical protein IQ266_20355 [filamentous cyanobacterium LEGE 11480]|uniref:SH3 domain-containing protein n=1 Tax=Romeriopsis navalis LEGE 11480 TaxID=2777977 RepID=A0A928VU42_9CYAN|nr:hypothetical protein [Romeriopsis navalis]MBE9032094.1 hypothetical protein [Romeriopsis navalis LEGE 11480]